MVSAAEVTLGNSMVVTSNYCVRAIGSGARAWVSGNTLTNCSNGLHASSSGLIESAGNNMWRSCGVCVSPGVSNVGTQ